MWSNFSHVLIASVLIEPTCSNTGIGLLAFMELLIFLCYWALLRTVHLFHEPLTYFESQIDVSTRVGN
jgi:hypothetical protein